MREPIMKDGPAVAPTIGNTPQMGTAPLTSDEATINEAASHEGPYVGAKVGANMHSSEAALDDV